MTSLHHPPRPGSAADHPALSGFHEAVRAWFGISFHAPTRAQELGWPLIQAGQSTLILAPTGSGKTLAAFLAAIDRLMFEPAPPKGERCRVLYVSPLKALAVDVERNLRAPLVGVARQSERMGHDFHLPEIAVRTGDTPQQERALFARQPADILITTPESLYLLLTSQAREALRSVRWAIVDEIHTMVSTKRGAHLALSLERLEELTECPLQRIGLSATVEPVAEAAAFLGGGEPERSNGVLECWSNGGDEADEAARDELAPALLDTTGPDPQHSITPLLHYSVSPRPVAVADGRAPKTFDLRIEVPVEDMARLGEVIEIPSGPAAQGEVRASIWPSMHPVILELIRSHRSTLIFVNSRRLAERLAAALNELAGEELVKAHHGSIARDQRLQIEEDLKAGRLPAMVATSSLELGIDMGAIDLVVQVEAPPSVASAIQRIGRAGHHIGAPSKGVVLPKYRGDLLACAALVPRMRAGDVEPMRMPQNPLDVLAQHLVAMIALEEWSVDELYRVVRRAAPFAELSPAMLEAVLDMLSGRYPSDEFAELRPRVTWDRLNGTVRAREGSRRVAITNGGTIPDRGLYGVFLAEGDSAERRSRRVGELDEEMVFESRVGETFLLGASSWRIEQITHDRVLVSPAPGQPGKMPFWHGDRAGRPLEFGRAIGALCRRLRAMPAEEATRLLQEEHALDERAARNLLQYLEEQFEAGGAVPDDRTLVIERVMDEMGDWRVCILSPFGSRVHAPWALAIEALVRERGDLEIELMWTDDGIVARFPEADEPPPEDAVLPDPDEVEDLVVRQLGGSSLFAARFREAAARALLLPRRHPGRRAPLWQQRKRAADLLRATAKYGSFPIILETYRECLRDVFDIPALVELLRQIRRREVRTVAVTTRSPSPFAASVMFNYVASFIYDGDAPLAERRAQALLVDPAQLRELLGEVELRELLDPDALEALELHLQHLTPERAARHADGVHDMLLRLGDLGGAELAARTRDLTPGPFPTREGEPQVDTGGEWIGSPVEEGSPSLVGKGPGVRSEPAPLTTHHSPLTSWLSQLERERRVVTLPVGGEDRYVAAEDVGRYRDALGIPPPPGLPQAFLEPVEDALGDLVARYARTHGPFEAADAARRFGLGVGPVLSALRKLDGAGRVVQGGFRPAGSGVEWCDTEVLRQLRQKSLARLRREVEPVEPAALGRLYGEWQGVATPRRGPDALLEALEQLQGAAIPASILERQVLPARVVDFDPRDLDEATSSGSLVWVGREPLGQSDGRVSLYLVEHAALLLEPAAGDERPTGPLHERIREHLAARGASFFPQLLQACGGGFSQEVRDALWDLVWAGEVTNDTLQPLRAYLDPRLTRRRSVRPWRTGRPLSGLRAAEAGPARPALTPRFAVPPECAGRWSLVSSLVFGEATSTERLAARVRQLLLRYGVLTREAVHAEGFGGGFTAAYGVLKAMEEAGHLRRGYFVEGRGATQFAVPGAVDRLRGLREAPEEPSGVLLAAADPANPYGAALPWPEREEGRRPARAAGASVILIDGALAAWMGRMERNLLTFPEELPERDSGEVAAVIARLLAAQVASGRRRALFVKEVDGRPAQETALAGALREAGFTFGPHGFMKRS